MLPCPVCRLGAAWLRGASLCAGARRCGCGCGCGCWCWCGSVLVRGSWLLAIPGLPRSGRKTAATRGGRLCLSLLAWAAVGFAHGLQRSRRSDDS